MATRAGLIVAGVLAALVLLAPAPAQARLELGLQAWQLPDKATLQVAADAGSDQFRVQFDWSLIQAGRRFDWRAYDDVMRAAAETKISILPVLIGSPRYLSASRFAPPVLPGARRRWSVFVRDVATRYGRGGSFWKANPQLTPRPLEAYQVWNEPNLRAYWKGKPDAAAYVSLLQASTRTIRRVDPTATIVAAGLAESLHGTPVATYLDEMYGVEHARDAFDAVGLSAYAADVAGVMGGVQRARTVMRRHGDRGTPIWISEFGWATAGPLSPFRVSRTRQSSLLRETVARLRRTPGIAAVFWFAMQDRRLRQDEADWFSPHTGLFDVAGKPKPAWAAFLGLRGRAPTADLPSLG